MIAPGTATEFSVIISLVDHRDKAEECVLSFTRGQDFAPERFEIIVVSDGTEPGIDKRVQEMLREQDRFLVEPTRNEYRLFNRGAEIATGEVLVIVESHCVAESDFLKHFGEAFQKSELQAARGTSIGVASDALEEYEKAVFEESFSRGLKETEWNRVLIHCFAIRKRVYEEIGGFEERWENFGPWVLGARLHQVGTTIELVEHAKVRHFYMGGRDELRDFITRFTRSEWNYWAEGDRELRDRYFPEIPDWNSQSAVGGILTKSLFLKLSGLRSIRQAFTVQSRRMFLLVMKRARDRLFTNAAKNERRLIRESDSAWMKAVVSSSRNDFLEFWEACVRLGRFQAKFKSEKLHSQKLNLDEPFSVDRFSPLALYGWYSSETGNGGTKFSWCEPLCGIRVCIPMGVKRVLIEMETDIPNATQCRMVFADEVSWAQIRSLNPMVLEFRFPDRSVSEGWLTFVCPGFTDANENRILGMSAKTMTLSG